MCASILPAYAVDYFAHFRYLLSAEINWHLEKKEEALKDMDECIKASSRNAGAYSLRASMRGQMGNYKGALDDCNVALFLKPDLESVMRMRAAAKVELGDCKGGIDDLNKLINNDSRNVNLYLARSDAYMKANNEVSARKDIDKALEIDPQNEVIKKGTCNVLFEI